jgi:hypothetical protein
MDEFGSRCAVIEPRMLYTLTMRPASDFFSSGSSAFVVLTNEFVSNVLRSCPNLGGRLSD